MGCGTSKHDQGTLPEPAIAKKPDVHDHSKVEKSDVGAPQPAKAATAGEKAEASIPAVPAAPSNLAIPEVKGKLPDDARIVFILGGPGSGKGTQCEKIVAKYGFQHLSAGDLLRAEVASGSDAGKSCEELMKNGLLVPISVTLALLKNAMIKSGAKDFLIDGFPRALDQAHEFEASIKACEYVLFLECSEQEMEKRLLHRGQTSGRSDDNAETIRKRFHTFVTQSLPVIDHYEALNKCHRISSLPPPDEVFQQICKVLGPAPGAAATPAVEEAAVAAPVVEKAATVAVPAAAPAAEAAATVAAPAAKEVASVAAPAIAEAATAAALVEEPPAILPAPADDKSAIAAAKAELVVPEVEGSLPEDARIVFILGGPGSGKGTQCERIVAKYGFQHLSAGDLLRAEVASGSETGKACESLMTNGLLVPISVTLTLLKNAMIKSGAKDFLIDGFPRALDQAHEFEASIKACEYVLFLECSEQEMEKRLLHRGQTSGRSDDNAETIRKRFHTFVTQSLPVIDHYEALNKCHRISSLPPPDEVFQQICKVLGPAPGAKAELVVPVVEGSLPEDARIVFILGGPGSGKGTQCERIVAKYGFQHLSAGDLLRAEVASGSDTGRACESLMTNGLLVPISVTLTLLKNAMVKSGAKDFLIDGFPRALDQAHEFEASIKACEYVLFLECSEQEMEKRLLHRGQTSGRSDDNAETIRKRFHTFVTQSLPVIDHYEALNKCHRISSLPPPDEVFQQICKVLGPAPGAAEEAPVAAVEAPVVTEHVPAAVEEVLAAAEHVPAAVEELSAADEHVPAAVEELTEAAEHVPAAVEELPEAAEHVPAAVEELPEAAEHVPAAVEELPEAAEHVPAAVEELPEAAEHVPAAVEEVPAAAEHVPAAVDEVPAAAEHMPAAAEEAAAPVAEEERVLVAA